MKVVLEGTFWTLSVVLGGRFESWIGGRFESWIIENVLKVGLDLEGDILKVVCCTFWKLYYGDVLKVVLEGDILTVT